MSEAGTLNRRVTFRRPTVDGNGEAAAYVDVVTRDARVKPLIGGEGVQASRLAGKQPVIITVRRDNTTKTISNAWQAYDTRAAADSPPVSIKWDVTSVIVTEDLQWVEVQAVQRLGGDL